MLSSIKHLMLHPSFFLQTSFAVGRGLGSLRQEEEGVVITSCWGPAQPGFLPTQSLDSWLPSSLPQGHRALHSSCRLLKSSSKEAGYSNLPRIELAGDKEIEVPRQNKAQSGRVSLGLRPPRYHKVSDLSLETQIPGRELTGSLTNPLCLEQD